MDGKVGYLTGDMYHFTYENIEDHIATMNRFTSVASGEYENGGKKAVS